jgi:hypothetical protein
LGLKGLLIGANGFAVQSEQKGLDPIRPRYSPARADDAQTIDRNSVVSNPRPTSLHVIIMIAPKVLLVRMGAFTFVAVVGPHGCSQ